MKSSKKNSLKRKAKDSDPLAGDLSYLFDGTHDARRVSFELRPKDKVISLRLSKDLLDAVKGKANKLGIDYQKWIRIALEDVVFKKAS